MKSLLLALSLLVLLGRPSSPACVTTTTTTTTTTTVSTTTESCVEVTTPAPVTATPCATSTTTTTETITTTTTTEPPTTEPPKTDLPTTEPPTTEPPTTELPTTEPPKTDLPTTEPPTTGPPTTEPPTTEPPTTEPPSIQLPTTKVSIPVTSSQDVTHSQNEYCQVNPKHVMCVLATLTTVQCTVKIDNISERGRLRLLEIINVNRLGKDKVVWNAELENIAQSILNQCKWTDLDSMVITKLDGTLTGHRANGGNIHSDDLEKQLNITMEHVLSAHFIPETTNEMGCGILYALKDKSERVMYAFCLYDHSEHKPDTTTPISITETSTTELLTTELLTTELLTTELLTTELLITEPSTTELLTTELLTTELLTTELLTTEPPTTEPPTTTTTQVSPTPSTDSEGPTYPKWKYCDINPQHYMCTIPELPNNDCSFMIRSLSSDKKSEFLAQINARLPEGQTLTWSAELANISQTILDQCEWGDLNSVEIEKMDGTLTSHYINGGTFHNKDIEAVMNRRLMYVLNEDIPITTNEIGCGVLYALIENKKVIYALCFYDHSEHKSESTTGSTIHIIDPTDDAIIDARMAPIDPFPFKKASRERRTHTHEEYCAKSPKHSMCLFKGPSKDCEAVTVRRVLNAEEKEAMLAKHNAFRRRVAKGQQPGQPKAANMRELVWNDELEVLAQNWADQCFSGHETDQDKNVQLTKYENGLGIGQNAGYTYGVSSGKFDIDMEKKHFLDVILKSWYREVSDYPANYVHYFIGYAGHYTQMVWAEAEELGCGYILTEVQNNFEGTFIQLSLKCNYFNKGNELKKPLYEIGEPCSKCPFGYSCNDGLCKKGSL